MSDLIQRIQARLRALGHDPGPADGLLSGRTRAAIIAFQAARGLVADGIPGPVTLSHLFPEPVDPALGRDLDPPAAEPATAPPVWPRQGEVERVFGAPGAHQTRLALPYPMRLDWEEETVVRSFLIHERVHDSARRCLDRVADAYDAAGRRAAGLDRFGGCLNIRPMRGGTRPSMHSWGIAIDFDPARNALRMTRATARLARPDCATFWRIWEEEGWVSLGRARDYDWMHVQAARL